MAVVVTLGQELQQHTSSSELASLLLVGKLLFFAYMGHSGALRPSSSETRADLVLLGSCNLLLLLIKLLG